MLALSDRAENLEGIEGRLKQDILAEGAKFGGLALTHNEIGEAFAFNINYQPRSFALHPPFMRSLLTFQISHPFFIELIYSNYI